MVRIGKVINELKQNRGGNQAPQAKPKKYKFEIDEEGEV